MRGKRKEHSLDASDALRLIEDHSRFSFAELSRIRRRQNDDYRLAVELAARQQPEEAFAKLDALGAIADAPDGVCNPKR